jgi:hypothetical protein
VTETPDSTIAALAVQLAALRSQVRMLNRRLDQAGLKGDLDLAARFEELARTVADALDAASPRGPAAPYWLDLDREAYEAQLADLRAWVDTVLRPNYGGYELRDCWPSHIHVIWELSTLAAEWHRTYSGERACPTTGPTMTAVAPHRQGDEPRGSPHPSKLSPVPPPRDPVDAERPRLTEPMPVRDAIAEYIAKLAADAPRLPAEARAHLAALLTGTTDEA